jgi:hypothetical protein
MIVAPANETSSGDVADVADTLAEAMQAVRRHDAAALAGADSDEVAAILALTSFTLIVCIAVLLVGCKVCSGARRGSVGAPKDLRAAAEGKSASNAKRDGSDGRGCGEGGTKCGGEADEAGMLPVRAKMSACTSAADAAASAFRAAEPGDPQPTRAGRSNMGEEQLRNCSDCGAYRSDDDGDDGSGDSGDDDDSAAARNSSSRWGRRRSAGAGRASRSGTSAPARSASVRGRRGGGGGGGGDVWVGEGSVGVPSRR